MILLTVFLTAAPVFLFGASEDPAPAERKKRHQLGVDVGSAADPDILSPSASKGIDRHFEWDYRFVIRDDRAGINALYHNPKRPQKMTFSFRQRMDFPARAGIGPTRNKLYKAIGQKTKARDVNGYGVGSALVLNHYWGISLSHDEYVKEGTNELFNQHTTVLALGYSPLGDNKGRPWSYTIDPNLSYVKYRGFKPTPTDRWESFGYSMGASYYYGLDWVRMPFGKSFKLDRLKISASLNDSEAGEFSVNAGMNVTAYVTRHVKLTGGVDDSYAPGTGKQSLHVRGGLSLRVTWSDLNF